MECARRKQHGIGMERQPGRSAAVAQFGRVGCLGASQSFGLRRQASWLKVWRGGGCNFRATERAHKRNGGQVVAEWRLPSLVTTLTCNGIQPAVLEFHSHETKVEKIKQSAKGTAKTPRANNCWAIVNYI